MFHMCRWDVLVGRDTTAEVGLSTFTVAGSPAVKPSPIVVADMDERKFWPVIVSDSPGVMTTLLRSVKIKGAQGRFLLWSLVSVVQSAKAAPSAPFFVRTSITTTCRGHGRGL